MTNLSPSLSLIKELDDIYQVLITKECFPLALKTLELKARLINITTNPDVSWSDILCQMSDVDLEALAKRLADSPKVPRKKDRNKS